MAALSHARRARCEDVRSAEGGLAELSCVKFGSTTATRAAAQKVEDAEDKDRKADETASDTSSHSASVEIARRLGSTIGCADGMGGDVAGRAGVHC